ncbi:MAG TPA: alpha/beta hydrolase [Methylomirabilota bacterium]|nr:alpha/beta hydrolase [Methylomirabilota bacterium]
MIRALLHAAAILLALAVAPAWAQAERVVDVPTRPGVTARLLLIETPGAKATVILFAGGHGGLQIAPNGKIGWGAGNFLVRTRHMLAGHGLNVVTLDSPSDRQASPFLSGFRQSRGHVVDVKAVMAYLRQHGGVPVWVMGTSMGTLSATFVTTELPRESGGPDGLVLTSTILSFPGARAVPGMPLGFIKVPVLVVHHKQDGCDHCKLAELPAVMDKLSAASRKELMLFEGGSVRNPDPCEAFTHHGYLGIESDVVAKIAAWIVR